MTYINPDSDGKFYELHSLARTNCLDCKGCSSCCEDMGESIAIDPYDAMLLSKGLGKSLQSLIEEGKIALSSQSGLILPVIKMSEETNQCGFLSEEGRCMVHSFRPAICRLFPLGRNYEDGQMNYILLDKLCSMKQRSKMEVSKWLGYEQAQKHHDYTILWHYFVKDMSEALKESSDQEARDVCLYILHSFYLSTSFQKESFYDQMTQMVEKLRKAFLE